MPTPFSTTSTCNLVSYTVMLTLYCKLYTIVQCEKTPPPPRPKKEILYHNILYRDKELDLTTLSTHIDATLSTAHAKCDSASARGNCKILHTFSNTV